jgi:hypothetical protein
LTGTKLTLKERHPINVRCGQFDVQLFARSVATLLVSNASFVLSPTSQALRTALFYFQNDEQKVAGFDTKVLSR